MHENQLFQPTQHVGGFAFAVNNALIDHWLAAWDNDRPLLDIGCGNGINTRKAVEFGARVVATEMDTPAVSRLQQQFAQSDHGRYAPEFCFARLPDQIPFADESFSGILCSEVFHFLRHAGIIAAIWELYRLLKPGGTAVVTCCSEYVEAFKGCGIALENSRRRQISPLYFNQVENFLELVERAVNRLEPDHEGWRILEQHRRCIPTKHFTMFNEEQLGMAFEKVGFTVELCTTGPAPHFPLWDHGEQDQVRIIARKP